MTLRLLLEDYLALMKEAGELDTFLPLLLSGMGHEIVYRAQGGIRQFGADLVTSGPGEDRRRTLFIWVVKCGDVTRSVWDSAPQAIRPSIEDVADVYLESHIAPQHRRLPKQLIVVTNGDFRPDIAPNVAGYLQRWSRKNRVAAATVNGSTLAVWTERFLLNEYVLPGTHRPAFRGALATIETPESSYRFAQQLVDAVLRDAYDPSRGTASAQKRVLASLRAVITFNAVIAAWGRNAGNLEAPYLIAEFSLLSAWTLLCKLPQTLTTTAAAETVKLVVHYLEVAERYHAKLLPFYSTEAAFATRYPDNAFVVERVFTELGRLGLVGVTMAWLDRFSSSDAKLRRAEEYAKRIAALLETHSVSGSPCFDYQAAEISIAMLALVMGGKKDIAKQWLAKLLQRLEFAKRIGRLAPISTDSFDDLIALRFGDSPNLEEFSRISTIVPTLDMWCILLDDVDGYKFIVQKVAPLHRGTTFNMWSPDAKYEVQLASPSELLRNGIGEGFHAFPDSMSEYGELLGLKVAAAHELTKFRFCELGAPWISLMSARHWHVQIPRRLVRHILEQFGASSLSTARSDDHSTEDSTPSPKPSTSRKASIRSRGRARTRSRR